jgi:predicted amidohydrolase YtcJ
LALGTRAAAVGGLNVPLPIAGEVHALAALHRQRDYARHLTAIRDAALLRVAEQIRASDMVMNFDFSAAQADEIFRVRFISKRSWQAIPWAAFVSVQRPAAF